MVFDKNMIENKDIIKKLSQQYENFYLYDEQEILKRINILKSTFSGIGFLYSVKCNPNPHVVKCIFSQGFGADAASLGEVLIAGEAGLSKEQIYYSAPGKTIEDIKTAISKSVIIADSIDEIKRIDAISKDMDCITEIGIRIHPDFSFYGHEIHPSKFGIDAKQAVDFIKVNQCSNIKITGIHIHLRSQELNTKVLGNYYQNVFDFAERFQKTCGIELKYLNMGSGIGIPYSPDDISLDLDYLGSLVEKKLSEFSEKYPDARVFIETGRFVAGKSGVYVTRILDRKVSQGKTYLIAQNTLNGFVRPSLEMMVKHYVQDAGIDSYEPFFTGFDSFQIYPLKDEEPYETVTIVGNLCTGTDVIAENIMMPHLECGDVLVISNAGAYAAVLSPMQFASQKKPLELFLKVDGKIAL